MALIDKNAMIIDDNFKGIFEDYQNENYNPNFSFENFIDRLLFDWSKNIIEEDFNDFINNYGDGFCDKEQYNNNELFFYDGEVWASKDCLKDWIAGGVSETDDLLVYETALIIIKEFHEMHNIKPL